MYIKGIKIQIREDIAFQKKLHDKEWLKTMSHQILSKIEETDEFRNASSVALYHAIAGEVQTSDFINKWYKEKQIYLPVIEGDNLTLRLYSGPESVKAGVFGILEPIPTNNSGDPDISLIIVPGVAFDRNRNRMGRGKGYYDRLLKHNEAYKIGICYGFQLIEEVPVEHFDIPMDMIITESEVIRHETDSANHNIFNN
ncbi:MAG: 5-formyltetrahydrofolate cyclo-ligase [Parabacteroides sp.]|nr:5-formyltetrahydrofolate cyclo-ligase [Parabacteroides sp.]